MKTKTSVVSRRRKQQLKRLLQWVAPLPLFVISTQSQVLITRTFTVNQSIPDGFGSLLDVQSVAVGAANIDSLQVSLKITGRNGAAFNGDLYASIGNDTGGFAVLLNRSGKASPSGLGYSDNGYNVTFDDLAANGDIHTYRRLQIPGSNPLTGAWQPDGRNVDPLDVVTGNNRNATLASFNDTTASGVWRLLVSDVASADAAQLVSWGFTIRTTATPTGPIAFNDDTVQATAPQTFNNNVTLKGNTILTGSHPLAFTAPIQDASGASGGLTVSAGSMVTLTANNTYSGGTTIEGGHLTINNSSGSGTGSGAVTVSNGGVLSGGGFISGNVLVASGGIIAPGNSPGTLTVGDTAFSGGGSYLWYINQAGGAKGQNPGWSLLEVNGTLTINATAFDKFVVDMTSLTLSDEAGLVHDFDPSHSYRWAIAHATSGVTGFNSEAFNLTTTHFANDLNGGHFDIELQGNDITLVYTVVPEPVTSAGAAVLGLFGFAVWRRIRT